MRLRGAAFLLLLSVAGAGASTATGDSPAAGNDVYRVFVEDTSGHDGIGVFTIATGPGHPLGEGREVLFGRDGPGDAATSYMTLRSYTTGTDYVQTMSAPSSGNPVVRLEEFGTVEAIGSTGYRTTYELPGAGAPDSLRIVSGITVSGSALSGSSVRIATTITNAGDFPVEVGLRYLLDVAPGGDDGPMLLASGAAHTAERTFNPAPDSVGVEGASASLRVDAPGGSGPDTLKYAYWPDASSSAFDYTTKGRNIASPGGLDDAALLYYFGAERAAAIRIGAGETATVSLVIAGPIVPGSADGSPTPGPAPAGGATPAALPRTGGATRP